MLGRFVDRLLLVGKIGEGGMGAVYLAIQEPLRREVAVKLVSGCDLTEEAITRFEREARSIALLDHPNIVKLFDYGVDRAVGVPYMVMEYARDARPLRRALEAERDSDGNVPLPLVLKVFRQVLEALGAAHACGIVHRDLKPDNVVVAPIHGNPLQVRLLDFGLAKAIVDLTGFEADVSRADLVVGTPQYMAPEQATRGRDREVDGRADLYGVAVMLFEVLTGSRPFGSGAALEVLARKTDPEHRPFDASEARRIPPAVCAVIRRGMAREAADRFATAADMLEALEAACTHVGTRPPPEPDDETTRAIPTGAIPFPDRRRRLWYWVVPAVLAVAVAASLVLWLPADPMQPPPPPPASGGVDAAGPVDGLVPAPMDDGDLDGAVTDAGTGETPSADTARASGIRKIRIRTEPAGATVRLNGKAIGVSPVTWEVPAGAEAGMPIRVSAHMEDREPARLDLRLRDLGEAPVVLKLRKKWW
jgi:serine/threonine-protein kinase